MTPSPSYEEALRTARLLIEPGENPEYERGMAELISDLWGVPELDAGIRREQVLKEIYEADTGPWEEPTELHEVSLSITTTDPTSLIEDLKAYGYEPHEIEVEPTAAEEDEERIREDEYRARCYIERTIEIAQDNLKRMQRDEPFSDELTMQIIRHMRLARELGRRNPKFNELADELKSVIHAAGTA